MISGELSRVVSDLAGTGAGVWMGQVDDNLGSWTRWLVALLPGPCRQARSQRPPRLYVAAPSECQEHPFLLGLDAAAVFRRGRGWAGRGAVWRSSHQPAAGEDELWSGGRRWPAGCLTAWTAG